MGRKKEYFHTRKIEWKKEVFFYFSSYFSPLQEEYHLRFPLATKLSKKKKKKFPPLELVGLVVPPPSVGEETPHPHHMGRAYTSVGDLPRWGSVAYRPSCGINRSLRSVFCQVSVC